MKNKFLLQISILITILYGMFHINLLEKNQNEKTLELTNLLGGKVWSQKTKNNSTTIDINHLPKGIYILNITDISSHYTERIIKN